MFVKIWYRVFPVLCRLSVPQHWGGFFLFQIISIKFRLLGSIKKIMIIGLKYLYSFLCFYPLFFYLFFPLSQFF